MIYGRCSYIDVTLVFEDSDTPPPSDHPQRSSLSVREQLSLISLFSIHFGYSYVVVAKVGGGPLLVKGLSTAAQLI